MLEFPCPGTVHRQDVKAPVRRHVVPRAGEDFLALVHARHVDDAGRFPAVGQQVQEAGYGLAVVEGHLDALDGVGGRLGAPVDHLLELVAQINLHRVVVIEYRVLRHAVGLDGVVVMLRGRGVKAFSLGLLGEFLVFFCGLAPDLGQHLVVVRALALGDFQVIALEVLDAASHVQGQVEHPLLVVSFGAKFANHFPLHV